MCALREDDGSEERQAQATTRGAFLSFSADLDDAVEEAGGLRKPRRGRRSAARAAPAQRLAEPRELGAVGGAREHSVRCLARVVGRESCGDSATLSLSAYNACWCYQSRAPSILSPRRPLATSSSRHVVLSPCRCFTTSVDGQWWLDARREARLIIIRTRDTPPRALASTRSSSSTALRSRPETSSERPKNAMSAPSIRGARTQMPLT